MLVRQTQRKHRDFVQNIDSKTEMIVKNLDQSCSYGLFKENKQQEYNIHIGFREALRQHNAELEVRLPLPITDLLDDTFVAGVPSEQG